MAGRVESIWRYPVKGLAGERLEQTALSADAAIEGDRRFAIASIAGGGWQPKTSYYTLMTTDKLALLRVSFDDETAHLKLLRDNRVVAQGKASDPMGRMLIDQFLSAFLSDQGRASPRLVEAEPGKPLSDVPQPVVSLLNLASVGDLERVAGRSVDPRRFRANLHFEGLSPWEENHWPGREITVGGARLKVIEPIERCAATEVNPETAERDLSVLRILKRGFEHVNMGVYARVIDGGPLATGDPVTPA